VARQAVGPLDQTADSWLPRAGKQSDIRRPPPHRKAGGQGCLAAARILKNRPCTNQMAPVFPSRASRFHPRNFGDAGRSTSVGSLVQLNFNCDALFSSLL
jgi:hypothetical protein